MQELHAAKHFRTQLIAWIFNAHLCLQRVALHIRLARDARDHARKNLVRQQAAAHACKLPDLQACRIRERHIHPRLHICRIVKNGNCRTVGIIHAEHFFLARCRNEAKHTAIDRRNDLGPVARKLSHGNLDLRRFYGALQYFDAGLLRRKIRLRLFDFRMCLLDIGVRRITLALRKHNIGFRNGFFAHGLHASGAVICPYQRSLGRFCPCRGRCQRALRGADIRTVLDQLRTPHGKGLFGGKQRERLIVINQIRQHLTFGNRLTF